jgi:hypothetical protein
LTVPAPGGDRADRVKANRRDAISAEQGRNARDQPDEESALTNLGDIATSAALIVAAVIEPIAEMAGSMNQRSESRAAPSVDGLDDDVWQRLTLVLAAANRADGNAMAKHLRKLAALPGDKTEAASKYLWYLLRFRVVEDSVS